MRLLAALVADEVTFDETGTPSITRGWPEWWGLVNPPPTRSNVTLLLVLERQPGEDDEVFDLVIVVRQHDEPDTTINAHIGPGERAVPIPGAPNHQSVSLVLDVEFRNVGPCEITVTRADEVLATVRFLVRLAG